VNAYNRFEACRYGVRGEMVEPYTARKKRIGDDILETIATIQPHAERLDASPVLDRLAQLVRHGPSDADWLRAQRGAADSLEDVVRKSAACWAGAGRD